MSNRVFNFSAGPAMLPTEVLEASAKALVDYQGKGFGIAECSHRGKEFDGVLDEAIAQVQEPAVGAATRTTSCSCRAGRRSCSTPSR